MTGMSKFIDVKPVKSSIYHQAVIDIKVDNNAERLIVMNRLTCELYYVFNCNQVKNVKLIMPLEHTTNNELLVGILDDDRNYNAKLLDARQADLINGNQVTIRP